MFTQRDWMVKQEQMKDIRRQRDLERLLPDGSQAQPRRSPNNNPLRFAPRWLLTAIRSW